MESFENDKVLLKADGYADLFICVQTLIHYDEYKYTLLNDPTFVRSWKTFDSRVDHTSSNAILVVLIVHPSLGAYIMFLFDVIVYSFVTNFPPINPC